MIARITIRQIGTKTQLMVIAENEKLVIPNPSKENRALTTFSPINSVKTMPETAPMLPVISMG